MAQSPYHRDVSEYALRRGPGPNKQTASCEVKRVTKKSAGGSTHFARKTPLSKHGTKRLFAEFQIYKHLDKTLKFKGHVPEEVAYEETADNPWGALFLPWYDPLPYATMDFPTFVKCMTCLTSTVAMLHEQGVIHCDIKPENVMWNSNKLVLIDFGFSALQNDASIHEHSTSFLPEGGTPRYSAPEAKFRRRSDVFSLGILCMQWMFQYVLEHKANYMFKMRSLNCKLEKGAPWTEAALSNILALLVKELESLKRNQEQWQAIGKLVSCMVSWNLHSRPTMREVLEILRPYNLSYYCQCSTYAMQIDMGADKDTQRQQDTEAFVEHLVQEIKEAQAAGLKISTQQKQQLQASLDLWKHD